jgi:selenide,water dikinase
LEIPSDPNLITGVQGSEDAGVYRLSEEIAIVQSVDFFTPIVDDPYIFGRAAAANSLSDIYAMGGAPVTALNIVCFPIKTLGMDYLREILKGGLDAIRESGAALVGGHSVEDEEPKYGLSVSGLVHPDKVMKNSSLRVNDSLILTKPLGTGLIATALKADLATPESMDRMTQTICGLNKAPSQLALSRGIKACTDITGFGLAGHMVEMARASRVRIRLNAKSAPLLPGALEYASMGLVPAGAHGNRSFFQQWITLSDDLSPEIVDIMFDPQTSGGLLLGVPSHMAEDFSGDLHSKGLEEARVIGRVIAEDPGGLVEIEP